MKEKWHLSLHVLSLLILLVQGGILWKLLQQRSGDGGSTISPLDSLVNETSRGGFQQTAYELYHVKNTIAKYRNDFSSCWRDHLAAYPDTDTVAKAEDKKNQGSIKVDWLIEPSGASRKVELVQTDFVDPELSACIIRVLTSMSFPPPPSGRLVYTSNIFTFKQVDPAS